MNRVLLLALIMPSLNSAYAESQIVYGQDNRKDLKNIKDVQAKKLTSSIAGRIFKYALSDEGRHYSIEDFKTLAESMNVCSGERFENQPTIVDCTGFLISPNLLATAGHCIVNAGQTLRNGFSQNCEFYSWIFDFNVSKQDKLNLKKISKNRVYGCKKVISAKYTDDEDFAVIELDRKVEGRTPLKINKKNNIKSGTPLFVLGHPSGLPLKYANNAKVFSVEKTFFSTNLDTFGGNSGSPVINERTYLVEGILVRGDTDYYSIKLSSGKRCNKVNICDEERKNCIEDDPEIFGEHVTNISLIKSLL